MAFEELKDRIKDSPVSTVISHYMTLSKRGATLEGICPFHSDTKPSLKVNDTKGMYKCFACGAGGDAITFVKEFKKIEFVDALREIAGILAEAGLSVELREGNVDGPVVPLVSSVPAPPPLPADAPGPSLGGGSARQRCSRPPTGWGRG